MTTPYDPVSFTSEPVTQAKLIKLASNQQWLYENMLRARYSARGITKDSNLRMIAGKLPYVTSTTNWSHTAVDLGNFFTVGCKPIVQLTLEVTQNMGHRSRVTLLPKNMTEIDHTGFIISVSSEEYTQIKYPGLVHWTAFGW